MSKEKKKKQKREREIARLKLAYKKAKAKKIKLEKCVAAYKLAVKDWKKKQKAYLDIIGKKDKTKKKVEKKRKEKKSKTKVAKKVVFSPDDLKVVEGIGPKIEELLNNIDIYTWKELAKAKVEDLRKMLISVNPRYRIHNPTHWPLQARLAAAGKWEELKVFQDSI